MNCLLNTIVVKDCCNTDTGRYINDLPGISMHRLQGIADREKVTYVNVYDSIQSNAVDIMATKVKQLFNSRFKLSRERSYISLRPAITGTNTSSDSLYKGNMITVNGSSQLTVIDIGKILVAANSTVNNVPFIIMDGEGNIIETITANVTIGLNEIVASVKVYNNTAYILYDSSLIQPLSTPIPTASNGNCGACIINDCEVSYSGVSMSLDYVDYETASEDFGLGFTANVYCDYAGIVCNNIDDYIVSWKYLLGAQIMLETKATDRRNALTTVDAKQAEELYNYYIVEFEKTLTDTVNNWRIDEDCCICCNAQVTKRYSLP